MCVPLESPRPGPVRPRAELIRLPSRPTPIESCLSRRAPPSIPLIETEYRYYSCANSWAPSQTRPPGNAHDSAGLVTPPGFTYSLSILWVATRGKEEKIVSNCGGSRLGPRRIGRAWRKSLTLCIYILPRGACPNIQKGIRVCLSRGDVSLGHLLLGSVLLERTAQVETA